MALPRKVAISEKPITLAAPPCCAVSWIGDSGSAFDIVRIPELDAQARAKLTRMATPTPLVTAGGKIAADAIFEVRVPEAGIRCDVLVLKTSPSGLSLGKGVMEEGGSSQWEARCLPILRSPNGNEIVLELKHNAPMLNSAHTRPGVEPAGGTFDRPRAREYRMRCGGEVTFSRKGSRQ